MTVIIERGVTATVNSIHIAVPPKSDYTAVYLTPGRNGIVRYSFAAAPGFRKISVRGGSTEGSGMPLKPAGVLRGSGSRYLMAGSNRIVQLRTENHELYELTKAMYEADDPVPGYMKVLCERRRLVSALGDSVGGLLITEVNYILGEEWPPYWNRRRRALPVLRAVKDEPECD